MNESNPQPKIDLSAVREKLKGLKGPAYWRSLDEVADTPEFQQWVDDEFPNRKDLIGLDRRTLLKFMGASFALAGLSGCRQLFLPEEKLVPYVQQPAEELIGAPLYYSTTMPYMGYGFGVLCCQREGRPIKLEGNPRHPMSLGSISSTVEAEMLNFYDPDRLSNVMEQGNISTWEQFAETAQQAISAQAAKKGAGLRFLTRTVTSPTIAAQLADIQAKYPQSKWYCYEPIDRDGERKGSVAVFGKQYETRLDLTKANTIVSLDADFLLRRPDSVVLARQWADGRRVTGEDGKMNRLYAFSSSLSTTAIAADHYWPVRPSEIEVITAAIAAGLGVGQAPSSLPIDQNIVASIVKDLQASQGSAVVIADQAASPNVHALCFAINEKLGAFGNSVLIQEPVDYNPLPRVDQITGLTNDLNQGLVDVIFIVGGNPVYDAPADLNFGAALGKAKVKVYLSQYETETTAVCDWTAPVSHPLEAWGDFRAHDGTISLVQPLIAPLYNSWSILEFLSSLYGLKQEGYDIVRAYYNQGAHKLDQDAFKMALYHGMIENSAQATVTPKVNLAGIQPVAPAQAGLEVKLKTCGKILDGSYANNGWLRELPDQVTKETWDNLIEISPAMAQQMNISTGNVLKVSTKLGSIEGPAWIQPGQPNNAITLTLGYGRTAGGVVATDEESLGYNAYVLRSTDAMGYLSSAANATIQNQGGDYRFANVQHHSGTGRNGMENRQIVREGTLDQMKQDIAAGKLPFRFEDEEEVDYTNLNLYPKDVFRWDGPQWGMTIDLTTCTGCNACVTACQAENNIPVIGKDQVARGREMHWIRIDRYYGTNHTSSQEADLLAAPPVVFEPVMCLQCEKAPCEPVCPVAATVHSHDGINQMVYNRCVGTRYCSDNCPYKVRRFNWLNYQMEQPQYADVQKIPLLKLLNNPDVTVRSRGVMEKCNYCLQRISNARIEAKKAGLPIADGQVLTACQQACPTRTITFGNIADPDAKVAAMRKDPRSYLLLEDLNTRPRTSHMARLRNPNPEIVS